MDLDFDLFFDCWGEFLKCSAGVYTFLFISKIHPNTEIRDRNLSPSKVVTFLYVGRTSLCYKCLCRYFLQLAVVDYLLVVFHLFVSLNISEVQIYNFSLYKPKIYFRKCRFGVFSNGYVGKAFSTRIFRYNQANIWRTQTRTSLRIDSIQL